MSLDNFKTAFENTYQEFFPKVLMAMKIANTRFESNLTYGQALDRVRYDISGVDVQDVIPHTDMSIDALTDSSEQIVINNHKGVAFPLSAKERVQAGPLNPGTVIGGQVAVKLATYVDADVLAEVRSAANDFDNGDLTTLASDGSPILMDATNVPKMVSRMPAKLRRNNQSLSNLAFVLDSYGISDMFQYLLGKNADFVSALFRNGYVDEQVASADVYCSENLTGEATLLSAGTFSNGETFIINGVTITAKTALDGTAGSFLIGADAAASIVNIAALLNGSAGAGTLYTEFSAANRRLISKTYRITATATSATVMTIVGKGSGRFTLSEAAANWSWSKNFIHAYFGKKGAIDVVVQRDVKMDMRPEPKQPGTDNVLSDILYGIKTFWDGSQKFLDVLIAA